MSTHKLFPRLTAAAIIVACACVIASMAGAQTKGNSRDALVVSSAWLAKHLHDDNLVLLQLGEDSIYKAGHIPGARFVDPNRIDGSVKGGLDLEMPTPDSLRAYLSELGISDNSRIVVYYGQGWVSPVTRLMLTLEYAGLGSQTSMLDGGMPAWIRDSNTTTADVQPVRAGTLKAIHTQPVVVNADYVKAHIGKPGFAIVDARAAAFYDGTSNGGSRKDPQRTGHITSAVSVPFNQTWNTGGVWKTPAELEALFTKAGVKPGDTVIGYCHVGQQATAMLFAARTLGHPVVLYDGSFEDWSAHKNYPVENPAARGK